jgi:hypothetical protein
MPTNTDSPRIPPVERYGGILYSNCLIIEINSLVVECVPIDPLKVRLKCQLWELIS